MSNRANASVTQLPVKKETSQAKRIGALEKRVDELEVNLRTVGWLYAEMLHKARENMAKQLVSQLQNTPSELLERQLMARLEQGGFAVG